MSTTIESLEVEVQSSATSAVSGIDALASSLGKLKSATKGGVGLTAVAKQLTTLNNALNGISGANADNLNKLAQGLQTLSSCGNLKLSSSVSAQITNIGAAVKSLGGTDFSVLSRLADSLAPLGNIGKSNLNSFISQLQRLPQAVQALNGVDIGGMGSQISQLMSALAPLSQMGKNNLTSFITQLQKLPQVMASLKTIDMGTLSTQIQQLSNALAPLATQMQSIANGFSAFPAKIQRLISGTNNLTTSNNRATTSYVNLAAKISIAYVALTRIARVMANMMNQAIQWDGIAQRFSRSFGEYAQDAYSWVKQLNEKIYINTQQFMQYSSIFASMLKGYGIAQRDATTMAVGYTELAYDIWAGYNDIYVSFDDAATAVRATIAGEVEQIRRAGFTIVDSQLALTAANHGVVYSTQRATEEMKSYLRYLTLVDQANAQGLVGTYAKEMNTAEGLIRTLKQQLISLAQAFGSVFLPILAKVLPYVQAFVQLITEAIKAVASLFGVEIQPVSFDSGASIIGDAADGAGNLKDNLTGAGKEAKKLKDYLLGIDELNVLKPEDNSNNGGIGNNIGGSGGGLDVGSLWDESIFADVNKQVDEIKKKLEKLLPDVLAIGAAFLAWKLAKGLIKALEWLSTMKGFNVLGSVAFKVVGLGLFLDAWNTMKEAIQDIMGNGANFTNVTKLISGFAEGLGAAFLLFGKLDLAAPLLIISGLVGIVSEISDMVKNGVNWDNAMALTKNLGFFIAGLGLLSEKYRAVGGIGLVISGVSLILENLKALITGFTTGDFSNVEWIEVASGALMLVGGLIIALGKLKKISGNANVAVSAKVLTSTSTALSGTGGSLGKLKSIFPTILKGLGAIALIVGGVIALVAVIGLLTKIPGFKDTIDSGLETLKDVFEGMMAFILPLLAVSAHIVALGLVGIPSVLNGLAGAALIIGGISVLILAIGALMSVPGFDDFLSAGIKSVKSVFEGLWDIALPLSVLSIGLIALGIATPAVILSGLAGFALVIGGLSVVLVALGALNQIPGFSWIVGEGGKVLIQLGEILGGFVGSLVKGLLEKMSSAFPTIGSHLAGFMENAQPFFAGLKNVDADSVNAVKRLADTVLILTASTVLDGLTSWFTGGASMVDFGKELAAFGPYFKQYYDSIKTVKPEVITATSAAAQSLAKFASEIPNQGGVVAFFAGENSLVEFGEELISFGKSFAQYYTHIRYVKPDVITATSAAAQSLAEFASKIPNKGGVAAFFAGENSLATFGDELVLFGANFAKYYQSIRYVKPEVITATSAAAQSLAKFASEIPNQGGVVAFFAGENSIAQFGVELVSFGENFKKYSGYMSGIKVDVVNASTYAARSLVELASAVPSQGGFVSLFTGDKNIATFGAQLAIFGQHFGTYYSYVSSIDRSTVSLVSSELSKILDWSARAADTDAGKIKDFGNALDEFGKDFASFAGKIVPGFTEQVNSTYTTSKNSVITWATNIKTWFTNISYGGINKEKFATYATDIVNGFNNKITSSSGSTKSSITSWATNIKTWFTNISYGGINKETFGKYATDIVNAFKNGIVGQSESAKSGITNWANNTKKYFTDIISYNTFYDIAEDVIKGFNTGINDFYDLTRPYMDMWANDAKKTFKKALDSDSPSKVFERIGEDTVLGYNLGVAAIGKTTRGVVNTWADSFTSVSPVMSFAVDTSALRYYSSDSFAKSVSANVTSNSSVAVSGFKDGMEEFYHEYIEPTMSQMAEDMHRQADKNEQTIVQVGNRVVSDAVTTQQKANGYAFAK